MLDSRYALHVSGMDKGLQMQGIAEVNKINNVRFSAIWYRAMFDLLNLDSAYPHLSKRINDSAFLAKRLDDLLLRPYGVQVPDDPRSRVKEVLFLVTVLSHQYPFSNRLNPNVA